MIVTSSKLSAQKVGLSIAFFRCPRSPLFYGFVIRNRDNATVWRNKTQASHIIVVRFPLGGELKLRSGWSGGLIFRRLLNFHEKSNPDRSYSRWCRENVHIIRMEKQVESVSSMLHTIGLTEYNPEKLSSLLSGGVPNSQLSLPFMNLCTNLIALAGGWAPPWISASQGLFSQILSEFSSSRGRCIAHNATYCAFKGQLAPCNLSAPSQQLSLLEFLVCEVMMCRMDPRLQESQLNEAISRLAHAVSGLPAPSPPVFVHLNGIIDT